MLTAISALRPEVVIHTAAFTEVDVCESHPDRAFGVNALGTRHIAEAARRYGAHLVVMSTDYVFDGSATKPYVEWDEARPNSVYGRSKLGAERVLDLTRRSSALLGSADSMAGEIREDDPRALGFQRRLCIRLGFRLAFRRTAQVRGRPTREPHLLR